MIKHIVMVNFKPELSSEQATEAIKKMLEALSQIPGVKNLTAGQGIGVIKPPPYATVMLIDFDDEAQLKAYLEHPTHKAVVAQLDTISSDRLVVDCFY